jgi:hypothetical protein
MRLNELFEAQAKRIVAVMPGGFHPFHPGHKSLYDWAVKTFGAANVYVAATNDTATRPFPFEVKKQLAAMAGVPKDKFMQVKSPFNAMSYNDIVDDNTALVFVRSLKDKNEQPLPDQIKKNGEPGYLRTYTGKNTEPSNIAGYMAYGPTIDFGFSGMQIKSASELRTAWPTLSSEEKLKAAELMYGNGADAAVQLLDQALSAVEENNMKAKEFIPVSKPRNFVAKNQKTAGAGAHKDKKRAEKQGDVKHKQKQFEQGVAERVRDPEDWDEGNTEPPNNFAVYINGKKWKVFKGRGQFADDYKEIQHFRQLQNWAQQKSSQTGKKWEVYKTGEQATESVEEGWKEKLGAAALAGSLAFGAAGANARVLPGADPSINRFTGKPIATQQDRAGDAKKDLGQQKIGFSTEYLKKVADGKHPRPMISVDDAKKELERRLNNGVSEAPIEMDPADPMDPMIHSYDKANPAKLKYRMLRAAGQLKDLASRAENASPGEWQIMARQFEGLKMNMDQIGHALEELG